MDRPVRTGTFDEKQIGEELYLYGTDGSSLSVLNPTAAFIWKRCDGVHSVKTIIAELHAEYPDVALENLANDVQACLNDLAEKRLVSSAE